MSAVKSSYLVTSADGERADFPALGSRYVLGGGRTGGAFAIIEHTIPPRTLAAPMHVHEHEDEYSFVLAGRMGVQIGDEILDAGPGDLVVKPRGIPHAFWNHGELETRLLEIISPSGFEKFFAELAPALNIDGPPDFAAIGALQARYGLRMDFQSAERLMREHDLRA